MLRNLLASIWLRLPRQVRRWSMRLTHARFTATAAAVVVDDRGRVLLLKHVFRAGSGWGLPGGFIQAAEQPVEALRREIREEVGLELEVVKILATHTFRRPRQIEIVFHCRPNGDAKPQSIEVNKLGWFTRADLPADLPLDQQRLLHRTLGDEA